MVLFIIVDRNSPAVLGTIADKGIPTDHRRSILNVDSSSTLRGKQGIADKNIVDNGGRCAFNNPDTAAFPLAHAIADDIVADNLLLMRVINMNGTMRRIADDGEPV